MRLIMFLVVGLDLDVDFYFDCVTDIVLYV